MRGDDGMVCGVRVERVRVEYGWSKLTYTLYQRVKIIIINK